MKKTIIVVSFILSASAFADTNVSANDCGSTMSQVKQIVLSKFSHLNAEYIQPFLGRWRSDYGAITMSESKQFAIASWDVLVCPRADKSFVILWKQEKTKAGVMKMKSKDVITISQTKMGELTLQRDSTAARN